MPLYFFLGELVGATIDSPTTPGVKIAVQGRVAKSESGADGGWISVTIEKFHVKAESITDASQSTEMQPWTSEENPIWIKKEDLWFVPEMPWQE
ncbi:hypothetical protein RB595_003927 [Gaeumannomyces hyphopodioides]